MVRALLIFTLIISVSFKAYGEDEDTDSISQQLRILQEDIKTLEKAVYSEGIKTTSSSEELSSGEIDVLTKHLLKLSELE